MTGAWMTGAGPGSALERPLASAGLLAPFIRGPAVRPARTAHRIVHIADLTPSSGAADFLNACIGWAERHPERPLDLCWVGSGDLRGVLQAQPLPTNLVQVFAGPLDPQGIADKLAESGLLAVPTLSRQMPPFLLEGMAAGLAVLGSVRNPMVRRLVLPLETGWLFDPLSPSSVLNGLETALATPPGSLDLMRHWARARALGCRNRPAYTDLRG